MLAPTDYEITEVESGEEALAAIAKQRPDLILMDIQLPIMDGYTATSKIKADPTLRSIPIIAVTSYALSGEEKKARDAPRQRQIRPNPGQTLPNVLAKHRFSEESFE
jgi:two-component system cell cycle response regulator DivK